MRRALLAFLVAVPLAALSQTADDGQWTMPAKVVKNKVLMGKSGGEFGVRGWLTALDAATGRIAWRAYMISYDAELDLIYYGTGNPAV